MTGTYAACLHTNQSRSYLNQIVSLLLFYSCVEFWIISVVPTLQNFANFCTNVHRIWTTLHATVWVCWSAAEITRYFTPRPYDCYLWLVDSLWVSRASQCLMMYSWGTTVRGRLQFFCCCSCRSVDTSWRSSSWLVLSMKETWYIYYWTILLTWPYKHVGRVAQSV